MKILCFQNATTHLLLPLLQLLNKLPVLSACFSQGTLSLLSNVWIKYKEAQGVQDGPMPGPPLHQLYLHRNPCSVYKHSQRSLPIACILHGISWLAYFDSTQCVHNSNIQRRSLLDPPVLGRRSTSTRAYNVSHCWRPVQFCSFN